jgi:hypothetical protein
VDPQTIGTHICLCFFFSGVRFALSLHLHAVREVTKGEIKGLKPEDDKGRKESEDEEL